MNPNKINVTAQKDTTDANNIHRYDRQNLIAGWDQEKLTKATVTIVGSGNLAKYIALPLAALGVGNLRIIDANRSNPKNLDSLLDIPLDQEYCSKSLESALNKINPEIKVTGIVSSLDNLASFYFLEKSNILIDATNDPVSKSYFTDYCNSRKIIGISASADENKAKATIVNKNNNLTLMPMFEGKKQGDLVSLELGGIIAEEVKKILMKKFDSFPTYNYNTEAKDLFSYVSDIKTIPVGPAAFKDKKILMIGAGALGCFLGPATIINLQPERLDIIDYDTVEAHNLNRQVCFYDAVGKLKAESLAKVLTSMAKINKIDTKINSIVDKFTEKFPNGKEFDLIFDAVDSFYTKAILHNYSKLNKIPLISGGTDYRAATVLVYQPDVTSCFDCQINLSQLAIKTEIIRRTSCLQSPDPSVVMSNQIAGAMMVEEARRVLNPELYFSPINGEIKYISDFERRGGVSRRNSVCDCYKKGYTPLDLPDPNRVKVEEKNIDGKIIKEVYVDGKKI